MAGNVSGPALAAIGAGALLTFAGIKGYSVLATVQALVQGKDPRSQAQSNPIVSSTTAAGEPAGLPTSGGGSPAANMVLGEAMAAAFGWTGDNWLCLKTGWQEESGWSTTAANDPSDPYDHAYGIPQANPGTKMATAGSNWQTSAATQIKWGLDYIRTTYGSPSQVPLWSPTGPLPGYVGY